MLVSSLLWQKIQLKTSQIYKQLSSCWKAICQSFPSLRQSPFLPPCAHTFFTGPVASLCLTWDLPGLRQNWVLFTQPGSFPHLVSYFSNNTKNWVNRSLWKLLLPFFFFFISIEQSIFPFHFFLQGLRTSYNHYLYLNFLVSIRNCFIQMSIECLCLKLTSSIS